MQTVLVTGASGYIGMTLVKRLVREGHQVIALSRKRIDSLGVTMVEGSFTDSNTVSNLSRFKIDCAIHLGGVTGDASERDAMEINVAGSANLFRNLIDQGVKKFIVASSIAAVGCLTSDFIPRNLPIPDEHPCDSANVYGVSKYFIEELCKYYSLSEPQIDFLLFRIGAVLDDGSHPVTPLEIEGMSIPFCTLGTISLAEVVEAFTLAVSQSLGSRTSIINLVSEHIHSELPTIEALRISLGEKFKELDLSHYQIPGHEFNALYDTTLLRKLLGTVAQRN